MADKSARATLAAVPEFRSYPAQFQVRSIPGGSMVEVTGYASTYNAPYDMFDWAGPYSETARQGMCAKTIAEGCDTAFLANHQGLTMARTKAGTLKLSEDSSGLLSVATGNTARSDVRDLVTAIEDGNIDQMSFAFTIVRQQWSPDFEQRDLLEVNLNRGDVSAVNYGANPATSIGVAARAFRSLRPSRIHGLAQDLRAGKALSASTLETLSQILDLIASADDAVDQAQPLLADLMGVKNPDEDDDVMSVGNPGADDAMNDAAAAQLAAYAALLERRERELRGQAA